MRSNQVGAIINKDAAFVISDELYIQWKPILTYFWIFEVGEKVMTRQFLDDTLKITLI